VVEAAVFTDDDDNVLDEELCGWPAAKALPNES
jgi:hypothetical protein